MFTKEIETGQAQPTVTIIEAPGEGWEVHEEEDSRLVKVAQYRDWHRAERAQKRIDLQVSRLEAGGWA